MELFNDVLEYTTGHKDKLAIFDGNILVGSVKNDDGVKTALSLSRVIRPKHLDIGDYEDAGNLDFCNGYSFHFDTIESLDVVIDTLKDIRLSMGENRPDEK